jgi:hypothetical protein
MTATFLADLDAAARRAETAESAFRREASARMSALEEERAFAFRRLNLMRGIIAAVAAADVEGTEEAPEAARAAGLAELKARLGWASDSAARDAVITRFTPVVEAARDLQTADGAARLSAALAAFEAWYAETHEIAFLALFAQYIPETPLVDF